MDEDVLTLLENLKNPIRGSRVTVGLSGGADSVALCHFLCQNASRLGITVAAAHLNHGLRGAESDEDERFVQRFCEKYGIPLTSETLCFAAGEHPGEDALRQKRYDFLLRAAGDGFVATAHTLSDSCETLLFRLARGTRLNGLCGIPVQRGRILRPFARLTRADTEDYCRLHGLDYRTDSSNLSDRYARNRLRHACVPALESVNPRAQHAMGELMEEFSALRDYLDAQAAAALREAACEKDGQAGWRADRLALLPDVLLRRILASLIDPYDSCTARKVALAADMVRRGSGAVAWNGRYALCCREGFLFVRKTRAKTFFEEESAFEAFCVPAVPGRWLLPDGGIILIEELSGEKAAKMQKVNKKDLNNYLSYDKIQTLPTGKTPCLRFRRAGDSFAPGRGRGTKSLKKWFNEIGLSPKQRGRLPLVAAGGEVLWLADCGAAEPWQPTIDTGVCWRVSWGAKEE